MQRCTWEVPETQLDYSPTAFFQKNTMNDTMKIWKSNLHGLLEEVAGRPGLSFRRVCHVEWTDPYDNVLRQRGRFQQRG